MLRALLALSVLVVSLAGSGCLFSRKERKPKESPHISREIEETFRQRWVDQRAAELVTQGLAAEDARGQASREFRERYAYTSAAAK